jgi:hypothetical protein
LPAAKIREIEFCNINTTVRLIDRMMKKRCNESGGEPLQKQRKIDPIPYNSAILNTSSTMNAEVEKLLTPVDKPGVIRVLDRRINTFCFEEMSSLYSLLRAWVQDDPEKSPFEVYSFSIQPVKHLAEPSCFSTNAEEVSLQYH